MHRHTVCDRGGTGVGCREWGGEIDPLKTHSALCTMSNHCVYGVRLSTRSRRLSLGAILDSWSRGLSPVVPVHRYTAISTSHHQRQRFPPSKSPSIPSTFATFNFSSPMLE